MKEKENYFIHVALKMFDNHMMKKKKINSFFTITHKLLQPHVKCKNVTCIAQVHTVLVAGLECSLKKS